MPYKDISWLDQLLELGRAMTPIALAFLAVVVRFMMLPHGHNAWTFLRGLFVAAFVATMVNSAAMGYGVEENLRAVLVGVSAFCADDILRGLVALGTKFREDPQSVLDFVLRRK